MSKQNEIITEALDCLEESFIGEALEYYADDQVAKKNFAKKKKRFIVLISAACLMLFLLIIPTLLIKHREHLYDPSGVHAERTGSEISIIPEHDGSRGLVYMINEDGKSASFVGFGSCTDEVVYIASRYGELPVTQAFLAEGGGYVAHGIQRIKKLVVSDTVEVFDESIISVCPNIESIYFGAKVETIKPYQDAITKVVSLEVSPDNEKLVSIDNCVIATATKTLVRGCRTSVIPSDGSVHIIGDGAFLSVIGLYNLTIPESVTNIGNSAFAFCKDLQAITLPRGLEYLGDSAFEFCRGLKSLDLNGYSVLPRNVLYYADALIELRGSENLTEIGESALEKCLKLKITLSPSLVRIEKYAFFNFGAGITFTGTVEEWNAIEKDLYWCAYSSYGGDLKRVECKDGEAAVTAMRMHRN